MTKPGRTPINVICSTCGPLWASTGGGLEFTQPPAVLFDRHNAICWGKVSLASVLGNGSRRVRVGWLMEATS